MASVFINTNPYTEIDYSLQNGRVREFVLRGVKLYDESDGTAVEGWENKLVNFVHEQALDVDHDGHGLHAFVYKMQDNGLLPKI